MKGTMIITVFGIIIFMTAAFFAFFAFDKLVSNELICIMQYGGECTSSMSNTFTFGIVIILTMIIMIVSAVYIMVKNITVDVDYMAKNEKKRRGA